MKQKDFKKDASNSVMDLKNLKINQKQLNQDLKKLRK